MKISLLIYLMVVLENFKNSTDGIMCLAAMAFVIGAVTYTILTINKAIEDVPDDEEGSIYNKLIPIARNTAKIAATVFIAIELCSILIPTKQEMAAIWLAPHIKNGTEKTLKTMTPTAQKLLDLTNGYLDKQLKEMKAGK